MKQLQRSWKWSLVCCYKTNPILPYTVACYSWWSQLRHLLLKLETRKDLQSLKISKMNNPLVCCWRAWWCSTYCSSLGWWCINIPAPLATLISQYLIFFLALLLHWFVIILKSPCSLLCIFKCDLCILDYFNQWTFWISMIIWEVKWWRHPEMLMCSR